MFIQFSLDQTLFGSLDGFVKAGTQFYRIQRLIEFFKQQGKGTLVTNVILINICPLTSLDIL